jgi:hypothetical protein
MKTRKVSKMAGSDGLFFSPLVAPDESPLLVRDASIQQIYALDWDAP